MLSVNLIQRYFDAGEHEKLVKGLASNGAAMPLPIQTRLSHPAPAIALALRRLVELTYGPTSLSRQMTRLLLALQRPGGSYAGADEADPIATAAAAAALGTILRQHRLDDEIREAIESAYERSLLALAAAQDGEGLFGGSADRTHQDRALTSAFVLSLLLEDDRFREAVRLADLLGYFEDRRGGLDRHTAALYRVAQARRPVAPAAVSPAIAGIAA